MGFEEIPYCEVPLRNEAWRICHIGPQNIDDEHTRHERCEYSGRDCQIRTPASSSSQLNAVYTVFFFVNGSQVRLVETGRSSTGRCMLLCFGGNLLPGARLFSYGADQLMLVCATVSRGCIFRVLFNKAAGIVSFFDEPIHPETEQLSFEEPRAVAFGCEVVESSTPGRPHWCTAIAVPGGKCWRVEPRKAEAYEVTGIHGVVGRIMTPVKNLWNNPSAYEVCALHLIAGPQSHESEIEWSIVGTCSDRTLRMWSRNQCQEVSASGPYSAACDVLQLVIPHGAPDGNEPVASCGYSLVSHPSTGRESVFLVGFANSRSHCLIAHKINIQHDGSCQWGDSNSVGYYSSECNASQEQSLVHFEMVLNKLTLLARTTRDRTVRERPLSEYEGTQVMMTTAMECVVFNVQVPQPQFAEEARHAIAQQAHEWRKVGFNDMNLFLQERLSITNEDVLNILSQQGWCLDICDTGCHLKGDPAVCDTIKANPAAFRAAVKAGVAAAVLGLPSANSQLLPLRYALDRLQTEGIFVPQLPDDASSLEINNAILTTLTSATEEREIEIAQNLALYTREFSANLCGPLSVSMVHHCNQHVMTPHGTPSVMVIRRHHAIGMLVDVKEVASLGMLIDSSTNTERSDSSRKLQDLLSTIGSHSERRNVDGADEDTEIDDVEFSVAPSLQVIHQVLSQHVSTECRLELLRLLHNFPLTAASTAAAEETMDDGAGDTATNAFNSFLKHAKRLIDALSGSQDLIPCSSQPNCDWIPPDIFVMGLTRRILHERLLAAKRLALLFTFVVVPNVHNSAFDYMGCIPQLTRLGATGRVKQLLVEVMTVLQALFISRWLTLQPVVSSTHGEPTRNFNTLSRYLPCDRSQMAEESILALYLNVHRDELIHTPINVEENIPVAEQASVKLAVRLTLAASLTCCSGEQNEQQDRDRTIKLCRFLRENGEYRTLESLLIHLQESHGDQADTPALMYLHACCCLQLGEDHRSSAYHERATSTPATVRVERTGPTQELGLVLHRSNDGLIVVGMTENGVAALSGQLSVGDVIVHLNGQSVTTMKTTEFTALAQTSINATLGVRQLANIDTAAAERFTKAVQYFLAAAPVGPDSTETSEQFHELELADAVTGDVQNGRPKPNWQTIYSYYIRRHRHELGQGDAANSGKGVLEMLQDSKVWDGVMELSHVALSSIEAAQEAAEADETDDSAGLSLQEARDHVLQTIFGASLQQLKEKPPGDKLILEQVISNLHRLPPSHKKNAVRQLVKTLVPVKSCVRDIEALCAVPLIGLEVDVEAVLWDEARNHDLSYYDVLHAYLSSRKSYRSVAASALEKAQRLTQSNNKNSTEALIEQASSYAAAANALQLVKSSSDENFNAETGGQYILCDYRDLPAASKRKRNNSGDVSEAVVDMTVQHKARVVVTLKQLEQWCAVTRAYVALAKKSVYARAERHAAVPPPPHSEIVEIVPRLLQYELYEAAVELCAAYDMPLVPIFEHLASHCIQSQMRGSTVQSSAKRLAATSHPALNIARDSAEWQLLYRLLIEHDQRHNAPNGDSPSFELHKAVLDRILSEDSRLGFPLTLLQTFRRCIECSLGLEMERGNVGMDRHWKSLAVGVHVHFFEQTGLLGMSLLTTLIGLAVKHHTPSILHEAAILLQDALRAHQNAMKRQTSKESKMTKVWFPFDQIDRLMVLLLYHGIPQEPRDRHIEAIGDDICTPATLTQDKETIMHLISESSINTQWH